MAKARGRIKLARNDEYGAQTRGQTLVYNPNDLTLVTDPMHPLFDPSVHSKPPEEMIMSIMEHGVLVPIVIRRNGTDKTGRAIIEVVDGRTRVLAAREACKRQAKAGVPERDRVVVGAVLKKTLRDAAAETAMVICNEHRRTEDVLTRADKLRRYLAHGHTEAQAKVAFSMKSRGFKVLMDVLEMGESLQMALREKKITLEIARTMSALPEGKQAAALSEVLSKGLGRGAAAKGAACKATKGRGSKPKCTTQRTKNYRQIMKAIDTVSCMPSDVRRSCILEALEWAAGAKKVAWSGEKS
jgi:ParB family chromosome partitioning protein